MIALIVILCLFWVWLAIKTTSFILGDLADPGGGKTVVIVAGLEGLVWPLTYFILMFFIVFGAIYGESLQESISGIKRYWRGQDE